MDLDLRICGGSVVDGSGAPARRADLGISEGRIVALSDSGDLGPARETIDAEGCWVTPGFIDPHTHLDAQLCWDASASPSNRHGVTTVAIGLSGLGVAPCRSEDRDYLRRSLAGGEEIPVACTEIGVPFGWETWTDYWNFLGQQPLEVNVAAYIPHSALRYYVMGERACSEVASDAEIRAMVDELRAGLQAGAVGFSTSRAAQHRDGRGDPVASRNASDDELRALVAALRGGERWYIHTAASSETTLDSLLGEVERYAGWSAHAGVDLSWGPLLADWSRDPLRQILERNQKLNDRGPSVTAQVGLLPTTSVVRFDGRFEGDVPIGARELIAAISELDHADRVRQLSDGEFRRTLDDASGHRAAEPIAWDEWVLLGSLSRPRAVGKTIAELSLSAGKSALDYVFDMLLDDDFSSVFQLAVSNRDPLQLERLLADENTLLGLGKAGAQPASTNGYSYPTRLLESFVRPGKMSIEQAVAHLAVRPARALGLSDRGTLGLGQRADLCVIDRSEVCCGEIKVSRDLPGGEERLFQGGLGYRAVVVNGVPTVSYDDPTGTGPGIRVNTNA